MTEQEQQAPAAEPEAPAVEQPTEQPAAVEEPPGPGLQEQVQALQAQLQEAEALKLATMKAAEDKIKAFQDSFGSERDKIATELAEQTRALAEQREKIEQENQTLADQKWNMTLDRVGVLETYRAMVPRLDLSTKDGQAKLEKFVEGHPEIIKKKAVEPVGFISTVNQKLKDVMSGKDTSSTFITQESIRKTYGK